MGASLRIRWGDMFYEPFSITRAMCSKINGTWQDWVDESPRKCSQMMPPCPWVRPNGISHVCVGAAYWLPSRVAWVRPNCRPPAPRCDQMAASTRARLWPIGCSMRAWGRLFGHSWGCIDMLFKLPSRTHVRDNLFVLVTPFCKFHEHYAKSTIVTTLLKYLWQFMWSKLAWPLHKTTEWHDTFLPSKCYSSWLLPLFPENNRADSHLM